MVQALDHDNNMSMAVTWISQSNILHICLLLCATGVSAQLQLEPLNLTVLQGSDAYFNATVQGAWKIMTWTVQEKLVVNVPVSGNITSYSEQYSARFCSRSDTSCVEFTIHNVNRSGESLAVTCSVLGDFGKTAQLYVEESGTVSIQEGNLTVEQDQWVALHCVTSSWFPIPAISWTQNGQAVNSSKFNTTSIADGDAFNSTSVLTFKAVSNSTVECWATVPTLPRPESSSVFLVVVPKPTDWTVLIAVVVSIGSFALLVLLIIGIIFCYKRRKEKKSNYEDEMRRVRTQSQISSVTAAAHRQGHVNAAYVLEGQTGGASSDFTDTNYAQMPDVVNSNQAGTVFSGAVDELGFKKHRHVTIV